MNREAFLSSLPERVRERFASKTQFGDECWTWIGSRAPNGYGNFSYSKARGKTTWVSAHRQAFEWAIGAIPPGLHVDHICRNRACVRPDHLEVVTPRENVLRGIGRSAANARKSNCHRGHPLSGDNLRILSSGARSCRVCQLAQRRARRLDVRVDQVYEEQSLSVRTGTRGEE